MMSFNKKDVEDAFFNYDITNYYEFGSALLFFCCDYCLLYNILLNIRKILKLYYKNNDGVSPGKLLCINSILLLSVIIRMTCTLYSAVGCFMSKFPSFSFDQTNPEKLPYISFNIVVYQSAQASYIAFEHLSQVMAANFWLQALNNKVVVEEDSNSQSIIRQSSSCMMNGFALLVRFSWIIVCSSLICSIILMGNKSKYLMYFVLFSGVMSSLFFCISCYLLVRSLQTQYKVRKSYNYKVKVIGITLIISQMVRYAVNIIYLTNEEGMKEFKLGRKVQLNDDLIPDQYPSWAVFIFIYSLIVDLYPAWQLSFLFSPFEQKIKKNTNSSTSYTLSRSIIVDSASPQGSQEWGDL